MIGGAGLAPNSAPTEELRKSSYKNGLGGVEADDSQIIGAAFLDLQYAVLNGRVPRPLLPGSSPSRWSE
ncbi:uncharacterized protein N7487_003430 [Penicillium crustosum]|uniref:uncharacterized protein n=1 Tax=Penicillium crustosum TaxID=36656 RepID=UPI002384A5DE|nr:uncharacterized protein N7487_003430 [Penicillium crustosum]KAJ5419880.1 hypothetical protein N7487_003430 [Penicillium crustosum]